MDSIFSLITIALSVELCHSILIVFGLFMFKLIMTFTVKYACGEEGSAWLKY
jgi:hypothetical protein